MQQASQKRCKR